MLRTQFIRFFALICAVWLAACSSGQPGSGESGNTAAVVLAITTVPSDVACIEVTVTGSQTTTQRFDVTPSQSASLSVTGLSSGAASISERAFAVACNLVTATTLPTWVAQAPASVNLVPGQQSSVTIVLVRPSLIQITNDFEDAGVVTFSLSPSPVAFGNVAVGSTSTLSLTVTNSSTSSVLVPSLAETGTDVAQFALGTFGAAGGGCVPGTTTLAVGASCTLQVLFTPNSLGSKSATLILGTAAAPQASVALSGVGVAAANFTLSPSPVTFGNVAVSSTSTVALTVTNSGTSSTLVPASLSVTGTDAAQFALGTFGAAGGGCVPGTTTLAVGASCALQVLFTPTSIGSKSATLTLGPAAAPQGTVAFSGVGVAAANFTLSPSSVTFGNVAVSSTSTVALTVTNSGTSSTLVPASLSVTGTDAAQFALGTFGAAGGGCVPGTTTLAVGASCALQVLFTPTSIGSKSATLTLGPAAAPQGTVALSGVGVAAANFTLSPSPVAFGNVTVNSTSTVALTVTNSGTSSTLVPSSLSVTGTDAAQFALGTFGAAGGGCVPGTTTLAVGASCALQVLFTPTSVGSKSATLTLGPAAAPQGTVAFSGVGVAPAATFSLSPSPVAFGNVTVNSTSTVALTVTNSSTSSALVPSALSVTGTDAAQFALGTFGAAGGGCVPGTTTLAVGASCALQVLFTPTSVGSKSATLTLGPAAAPQGTVAFSGVGVAPAATFSLSPSPVAFGNVTVNSTSTVALTVTNSSTSSTLVPSSLSVTGTDAAQFALGTFGAAGGGCVPGTTTLAVGASCALQVLFTPTSVGSKSATLTLGPAAAPQGTVAFSGVGAPTLAAQFCGTASVSDLGSLAGGTSPQINVSTSSAACFRFTVASATALLHGIQASNCSGRDVTINGTLTCPAGVCPGSLSVNRATDGDWYVLFSAGTATQCSSSWWWF